MGAAARAAAAEHQADGGTCAGLVCGEDGEDAEDDQSSTATPPSLLVHSRLHAGQAGTTVCSARCLLNMWSRCVQTSAAASATLR